MSFIDNGAVSRLRIFWERGYSLKIGCDILKYIPRWGMNSFVCPNNKTHWLVIRVSIKFYLFLPIHTNIKQETNGIFYMLKLYIN